MSIKKKSAVLLGVAAGAMSLASVVPASASVSGCEAWKYPAYGRANCTAYTAPPADPSTFRVKIYMLKGDKTVTKTGPWKSPGINSFSDAYRPDTNHVITSAITNYY